MKPATTDEARSTFFNETEGAASVFRKPGWSGCILDGDKYGGQRMSRLLWDLITACCNAEVWQVYVYRPIGDDDTGPLPVAPIWETFSFQRNQTVCSPEWIALDDTGEWAVLAEYDVTVFGCTEKIAIRARDYLDSLGTSLRKISEDDFPGVENWSFFEAVFSEN